MATDSLTLNPGVGGEELSCNDLAGGEKVQNVKLLSAEDASETQIYAGNGTAANSLRVSVASDSTGQVKLAAGTASVGTVGLNTGTNSVGTVGIDAGTAAIGSIQAAGAVAHDAAGTGILPILGGAIACEMDGTTLSPVAVAEGDITYVRSTRDGQQLVSQTHPASGNVLGESSSAQTALELVAQPAAGFSVYITAIQMSAITAQTAWLHDEDDGVVFPLQYFGANTGNVSINLSGAPIKLTAAKALEITTTAAVAHSWLVNYYIAV